MNTRPVLLVYAPPSDPTQSYTSLPTLTAYLRAHGIPVIQRDLGIEVLDQILDAGALSAARTRAQSVAHRLQGDASFEKRFEKTMLAAKTVIEEIDRAKAVMRSSTAFYNLERYRWATNIIELATDLFSLPYHPTQLSVANYVQNVNLNVGGLHAAIADPAVNLFTDIFDHDFIGELLAAGPRLVAISVTYHFQVVPAFTLARAIKRLSPETPITMGGAIIARMESHLLADPRMFTYVDHFVVGEGESALLHLARMIEDGTPLELAPNQISLVNGVPTGHNLSYVEPIRQLPALDFEGLDLARYLSPEPVILLPTSRGCYWGKCTFCDVSRQTRQVYRPHNRSTVVRDMLNLRERYGVRRFFFCDDAVPLGTMREVSERVACDFPDATWQAEVRLEKGFTREFIATLHQGGCRQLMFGLESRSQRVLDRMLKNNTFARDDQIIRDCGEAGIGLNLQTFIGLPTETREEAEATVEFLLENERYLSSIGFGLFSLWKETPIYNHPDEHGVKDIFIPIENSLLSECEFETTSGMTRAEATQLYEAALLRIEPVFRTRSHYIGGASGSHSLLHFSELGFEAVRAHWSKMDSPRDITPLFDQRFVTAETSRLDPTAERCFLGETGDFFDMTPHAVGLIERCRRPTHLRDLVGGAPAVTDLAAYAAKLATVEAMVRCGLLRASGRTEAAASVAVPAE